jgi:hypothetical protein
MPEPCDMLTSKRKRLPCVDPIACHEDLTQFNLLTDQHMLLTMLASLEETNNR